MTGPTVLLSLLAAVFASAVALFVVSRKEMGWIRALAGSAIMGGGISTMHYTGMAAMRLRGMCSYDPLLLILSVVFAIAISLISLWLTFHEFLDSCCLWIQAVRDNRTAKVRDLMLGLSIDTACQCNRVVIDFGINVSVRQGGLGT
jgi:NO-binding membrane sensor protein with MHYT domain